MRNYPHNSGKLNNVGYTLIILYCNYIAWFVLVRLLRLEGEVIEIIGEIVGCLGVHSADCLRAIDLLERLEEHKLNPLMLKKHPEVVHTIQKVNIL